eukprot:5386446-Pyramimonas_sp.AAC.1
MPWLSAPMASSRTELEHCSWPLACRRSSGHTPCHTSARATTQRNRRTARLHGSCASEDR